MPVIEELKDIIGTVVHETTEGSNCTGACILWWKLAFAACLVIEGLFFGHTIYAVRRATRKSVETFSGITHIGHAVSAGVFFATGMLHILPEAVSLMAGGEHGNMHREGDHGEEHGAHEEDVEDHSEGHGNKFPWAYFIVLVGFYALFFLENILIPKLFSAFTRRRTSDLQEHVFDKWTERSSTDLSEDGEAIACDTASQVGRSDDNGNSNSSSELDQSSEPITVTDVFKSSITSKRSNETSSRQAVMSESVNEVPIASRSSAQNNITASGVSINDYSGDDHSTIFSRHITKLNSVQWSNKALATFSMPKTEISRVNNAFTSNGSNGSDGLVNLGETAPSNIVMRNGNLSHVGEVDPNTTQLVNIELSRVSGAGKIETGRSCRHSSITANNNLSRASEVESSSMEMTTLEPQNEEIVHQSTSHGRSDCTLHDSCDESEILVLPGWEGFCSVAFATALLQVFGIASHSLFESIALGLASDFPTLLNVFIATAAHRWATALAISFSISTKLAYFPFLVVFALFSLMVPLGVGIGIAAHGLSALAQGILFSLSAGSFLYIGVFEVMAHEFVVHCRDLGRKFLFVLVGAGLITLITGLLVFFEVGH